MKTFCLVFRQKITYYCSLQVDDEMVTISIDTFTCRFLCTEDNIKYLLNRVKNEWDKNSNRQSKPIITGYDYHLLPPTAAKEMQLAIEKKYLSNNYKHRPSEYIKVLTKDMEACKKTNKSIEEEPPYYMSENFRTYSIAAGKRHLSVLQQQLEFCKQNLLKP